MEKSKKRLKSVCNPTASKKQRSGIYGRPTKYKDKYVQMMEDYFNV